MVFPVKGDQPADFFGAVHGKIQTVCAVGMLFNQAGVKGFALQVHDLRVGTVDLRRDGGDDAVFDAEFLGDQLAILGQPAIFVNRSFHSTSQP